MNADPRNLDTFNDHDEPERSCPACGTDAAPRIVEGVYTDSAVCPACAHVYWTAERADAPVPDCLPF